MSELGSQIDLELNQASFSLKGQREGERANESVLERRSRSSAA